MSYDDVLCFGMPEVLPGNVYTWRSPEFFSLTGLQNLKVIPAREDKDRAGRARAKVTYDIPPDCLQSVMKLPLCISYWPNCKVLACTSGTARECIAALAYVTSIKTPISPALKGVVEAGLTTLMTQSFDDWKANVSILKKNTLH